MFVGFYSPATPLLKAIWAPGFLLCAVACYVLRDASDRGRLGASTFKNLNLGEQQLSNCALAAHRL